MLNSIVRHLQQGVNMGLLLKSGLLLAFALAVYSDSDAVESYHTQALAPTPEVVIVGSFANNDQGDKVPVPCIINLYRIDSRLFGLLFAAVTNEDMPAGLLEDVRYDRRTGDVSFRVKLSIGVIGIKDKPIPSEDLAEFKGKLVRNSLSGTMNWTDHRVPGSQPRREAVVLRYSARFAQQMSHPKTYAEFQQLAERVLKARGPKW
jgi:hypothetical protein